AAWLVFAIFGYVLFRFARMLIRAARSPNRSRRRRKAFAPFDPFDPSTVGRPRDCFIRTLDQEFTIVPDYGPKELKNTGSGRCFFSGSVSVGINQPDSFIRLTRQWIARICASVLVLNQLIHEHPVIGVLGNRDN